MGSVMSRAREARDELGRFLDRLENTRVLSDEAGRPRELGPTAVNGAAGRALRDLAIAEGARRTLETGLAFGVSALYLCDALLASGSPDARHVAVDPYEHRDWGGCGLRALRDCGVSELVEFHEHPSHLVLPRLAEEQRRFDLAFVDGDHRFHGVLLDVFYAGLLLEPGRVVVVDDCWMPAVRLAVGYAQTHLGYELLSGALGEHEFSWPARRRPWGRRAPSGGMAALRTPRQAPAAGWDEFADFSWALRGRPPRA